MHDQPPHPISGQQAEWLLEHSSLAALGLLDEDDQATFDRLMDQASISLRDRVLGEQRRVTADAALDSVLIDDEPPPELRSRVVGGVLGLAREELAAGGFAPPLTTAGQQPGADADGFTPAEPDPAFSNEAAPVEMPASARGLLAALDEPTPADPRRRWPARVFGRPGRVHPAWRTAGVGSLAAVIALVFVNVELYSEVSRIDSSGATGVIQDGLGPSLLGPVVFDSDSIRLHFAADGAHGDAKAVAVASESMASSVLLCLNLPELPEGETYAVVLLDGDGRPVMENGAPVEVAERFTPRGPFTSVELLKDLASEPRLGVYVASAEGELLDRVLVSGAASA